MSQNLSVNDYNRFFSLRQKVYLVNISEERNSDVYESLSGVVFSCNADTLELIISQDGYGIDDREVGKTAYKLTSESLGSGIQIQANLIGIVAGNIFQLRMHGSLEMFQRRSAPRVDLSAKIFQLNGNFPLTTFKKKWQQVREQLSNNRKLPGLVLKETEVNLSVGGIGFMVDTEIRPTPLSMLFIAIDEGLPICVLTETAWNQRAGKGVRCGFRFIHILKVDQDRINSYLSKLVRESGGIYQDYKRNWVLIDKMGSDALKPL
jgi:hypothetical protein